MQKEITAAIAAYLEENLSTYHDGYTDVLVWKRFVPGMQNEIAREITAAIMPLLPGDKSEWNDAPDWAGWLVSNNQGLSQWFEDRPIWDNDLESWLESTEDGRYKFAGKLTKGKELQRRPK